MTIWPTFMHFLLSSLRSRIFGLGLTTFPVLYLVGAQNSGKSWLVEHYSLLYDDVETGRPYGDLDTSSTDRGVVYAVSTYKDLVVAVDDLPKSNSTSVRKKRIEVMEESIRFIANGTTRTTASKCTGKASQCCQTGAVCTGEISLQTASILTRILEVPLTQHKKTGRSSDRTDAATAFRWWIIWLLPHLDNELKILQRRIAESSGGENARLETTKVLFQWIVELFYQFAKELNFIGDTYYQGAVSEATTVFASLLNKQAEKVLRLQEKPPQGNLSYHILMGYHKGAFRIVSSRKKIKSDNDCLIEKDALCIRTATLLQYLNEQSHLECLTEKMMSKGLREENVLVDTREKRAAGKKINGKRFLELRFSALRKASQRY